jgi:4'-phosphopantetheinyl transferase
MVRGWGEPPARPVAVPGEVHLWRVDQSEAGGSEEEADRVLSAEERARRDRYRFPRDRRRFALRRSALRGILSAYLGAPPAEIVLVPAARSKPELAVPGEPPLRFNVSHSGEIALIGVTRGADLGVDVEVVRKLGDRDSVAREVFSPAEWKEYEALDERERTAAFFNGWTRKEAFLKAQGEGLFGDLAGFDVTLAPGREPRLLRVGASPGEEERWRLAAFEPAPGAVGAVAVRADALRLTAWARRALR